MVSKKDILVLMENRKGILNRIKSPRDLDKLTKPQIKMLAKEIRAFLIDSISKTGGHLASNLGVVELTLAIHKVFDSPNDKIVWDVGHQCYTHKILTGRRDKFDNLRKENGISGFPKPSESKHDAFIAGHSSTSISAGFGIAKAMTLKGQKNNVIAVIGDGAFTGGMVYEAFNNAGRSKDNLIVILNHNEMSISKNVGAFAKYLSSIRSKPQYRNLKKGVEKVLDNIPLGSTIKSSIKSSKSSFKKMVYGNTFFEDMGFEYLGPINGHSYDDLVDALETAKSIKGPVLVYVDTTKGKGYSYAEENPGAYHGTPSFDIETGNPDVSSSDSYSGVFGKALVEFADKDSRICAITAAMKYGTGLQYFCEKYKNRFFDVGIAEQHAVTFSAGLASQGLKPVFAVYSSFLQRGFDQIIHDCAIEKQNVVFGIDRAGIVGDDGETHQGVFDVMFLSSIPNITLYSPESYDEVKLCLEQALYKQNGVKAIRYPRGSENISHSLVCNDYKDYLYEENSDENLIVTYGRITNGVVNAQKELKAKNINCSVLKLIKISPLSEDIMKIAGKYKNIFVFEEVIKNGGIGQKMLSELVENGYKGNIKITAIKNEFIKQSSVDSCLKKYKLDKDGVIEIITKYLGQTGE